MHEGSFIGIDVGIPSQSISVPFPDPLGSPYNAEIVSDSRGGGDVSAVHGSPMLAPYFAL